MPTNPSPPSPLCHPEAKRGTCFPPPLCPTCTLLAKHLSPSLLDDITITLKVSQNLHAELLLHHLGEAFADDGSTAQSLRVVRQFALNAGLDPADFLLYDGSGLSGHDLVAPRALTQLLAFAAKQPWFPGFKAALPVGGVDGSLAARFSGPLTGRVSAKTGTLLQSRALSGYLTTASGQTLIFSILVDNHPTPSDRTIMDRIVYLIATQRVPYPKETVHRRTGWGIGEADRLALCLSSPFRLSSPSRLSSPPVLSSPTPFCHPERSEGPASSFVVAVVFALAVVFAVAVALPIPAPPAVPPSLRAGRFLVKPPKPPENRNPQQRRT